MELMYSDSAMPWKKNRMKRDEWVIKPTHSSRFMRVFFFYQERYDDSVH